MNSNLYHQLEQSLSTEYLNLIRSTSELANELGLGLYLVGGAVRDLLLDRPGLDIDLVIEGDAPKLANLLAEKEGGKTIVHNRFGTAKFSRKKLSIDFITARSETYAHPGALPIVRPGSIEDDLRRRDFTINAMAIHLDPDNLGKLMDPCGGEADLNNRLIRILHNKSFTDDATRILRALRYEQRFDFKLETTTGEALRQDIEMLDTISGDRKRHEIELILEEAFPEKSLHRASELGALERIHPSLKYNDWLGEKFTQARSMDRSPDTALYFSLMLYSHNQIEIEEFITNLKLPKKIARVIQDTLYLKENLPSLDIPELLPSAIYHLLHIYSPQSILANAIATESALIKNRLYLYLDKQRYIKPYLDGKALLQMGLSNGPQLGEIQRALRDARLDNKVKTIEEEKKLAQKLISEQT